MSPFCCARFPLLATVTLASLSQAALAQSRLDIALEGWSARLSPKGLALEGKATGSWRPLSGLSPELAQEDPHVTQLGPGRWKLLWASVQLEAEVEAKGPRLFFRFTSQVERNLVWPAAVEDLAARSLLIPDGEGLRIPTHDTFWKNQLKGFTSDTQGGSFSLPVWGWNGEGGTVAWMVPSDLRNTFATSEGRMTGALTASLTHAFLKRDGLPVFEMAVTMGSEEDLLLPALNWRRWLQENGTFKSLSSKTKDNPNVEKLAGAWHAYLWGTGRTEEFLETAQKMKLGNWVFTYETPFGKEPNIAVQPPFLKLAKTQGHLVGPYESFHTMAPPNSADSHNLIFPDAWPMACVLDAQGKRVPGFRGKGCHTSSQWFAQETPPYKSLLKRARDLRQGEANQLFLDCDATGELFDDSSPAHPQTMAQDRALRLERMELLSKEVVLGSESAASWSTPAIAYAHGNVSVANAIHWQESKDKSKWGGWWPALAPQIFFKPVAPSRAYTQAKFDPAVRLPLFEAAFHDSVVSTDRWEIPLTKFPKLEAQRGLMEALYGVPSQLSLDLKTLKTVGPRLQPHKAFFEKLHKRIFEAPLTGFQDLTGDGRVQETTFGKVAKIRANFSDETFSFLPPRSLEVTWLATGEKELHIWH